MTDADREAFEKWYYNADELPHNVIEVSKARRIWQAAIAYATSWKLPCDVRLPPVTTIRRGCDLSTLIAGIRQRKNFPEEHRVFPDRRGTPVASSPVFRNDGHDLPDTRDTDCPYCGGSGHKDDVVDHKSGKGSHKPARHGDPHIGAGHPESVAVQGAEADSLPVSGRPQPQTDLAEKARAFAVKWGKSDSFISTTEAIAAFATEHAAEAIEREKRKSIISIINLKALGKHFKARAETAEQYLAQAVEAEREACAKVADMEAIQAIGCNPVFISRRIADAIRSRKGGPYAT